MDVFNILKLNWKLFKYKERKEGANYASVSCSTIAEVRSPGSPVSQPPLSDITTVANTESSKQTVSSVHSKDDFKNLWTTANTKLLLVYIFQICGSNPKCYYNKN